MTASTGTAPTIAERWRSWTPYLLSVLRIIAAFLFIQFGTAKLYGVPGSDHARRWYGSVRQPGLVGQRVRDLMVAPSSWSASTPGRLPFSSPARWRWRTSRDTLPRDSGRFSIRELRRSCSVSIPLSLRGRPRPVERRCPQEPSSAEPPAPTLEVQLQSMVYLLALGSALFYGAADFTGGLTSRRAGSHSGRADLAVQRDAAARAASPCASLRLSLARRSAMGCRGRPDRRRRGCPALSRARHRHHGCGGSDHGRLRRRHSGAGCRCFG